MKQFLVTYNLFLSYTRPTIWLNTRLRYFIIKTYYSFHTWLCPLDKAWSTQVRDASICYLTGPTKSVHRDVCDCFTLLLSPPALYWLGATVLVYIWNGNSQKHPFTFVNFWLRIRMVSSSYYQWKKIERNSVHWSYWVWRRTWWQPKLNNASHTCAPYTRKKAEFCLCFLLSLSDLNLHQYWEKKEQ